MKSLYSILFSLICSLVFSQPKLLSWNLENFGNSKSNGEITFIANTVKDFNIVSIQEARMISNHIPIRLEFPLN